MKVHFCGGAGEVGASCILVTLGERRILLDCGMRMKGDSLPDLSTVQDAGGVDAIVLSHAHMDHSGSLPVLSEAFPAARLYLTPPTLALIRVLLYDSLKIMAQEEEIPTFDRRQVERMLERAVPVGFHDPVAITEGVELVFYPAGHILGAASAHLASRDGSVFYSGDLSQDPQRTVAGLAAPRLRPHACILESTYGDRLHANRKVEEARLIDSIREQVERGARMLLPSFAVGRAQEVILILRSAINRGQLPPFPIYVDGMVREVCRIYRQFPNFLREPLAKRIWRGEDVFFREPVRAVTDPEERRVLMQQDGPFCIVTSSGMLSGGPSAFYAQHLAADPGAYIAITGYQDEESPGRKLQELFRSAESAAGPELAEGPQPEDVRTWPIGGRDVALRCQLGTFGLSAHADQNQLLALIDHLAPKQVFLVHGDPRVLGTFGRKAQIAARRQVHVPANGASFLIEPRGGGSPGRSARLGRPGHSGHPGRPGHPGSAPKQFPSAVPGADLAELSAHLLASSAPGPWTAKELLQISGRPDPIGAAEELEMMRRLSDSAHFACDRHRLYLFRAVEAEETAPPEHMEVNQMLALARERFPLESGCYKTGARVDQKVARLSFRFPTIARERFREAFEVFAQETGWQVELNENPDTSYLQPLLGRLLGEEAVVGSKIAYHPDRQWVVVTLSGSLSGETLESLRESFRCETGLELVLDPGSLGGQAEDPLPAGAAGAPPGVGHAEGPLAADQAGTPTPAGGEEMPLPGGPACDGEPLLSQQEAIDWIAKTFQTEGVTIFRQSVKTDRAGKYLELQFLTPVIGRRHADLIGRLRDETRWRIVWSRHPRQGELITEARRRCEEAGLRITKGPSILPHGAVRVKAGNRLDAERSRTVQEQFRSACGYELDLIEVAAVDSVESRP